MHGQIFKQYLTLLGGIQKKPGNCSTGSAL
jgi:hypothetical protein